MIDKQIEFDLKDSMLKDMTENPSSYMGVLSFDEIVELIKSHEYTYGGMDPGSKTPAGIENVIRGTKSNFSISVRSAIVEKLLPAQVEKMTKRLYQNLLQLDVYLNEFPQRLDNIVAYMTEQVKRIDELEKRFHDGEVIMDLKVDSAKTLKDLELLLNSIARAKHRISVIHPENEEE